MRVSEQGLHFIAQFEGFSPTPYRCPAGYWTIGYGHVIADAAHVAITQSEAETLLQQDTKIAERAVMRFISVPLLQHQFDALVSFTFNLGSGALQRSTLRRMVNRGDFDDAGDEFTRWVYAGGKKLKGLVLRRAAERKLFMYNNWL